MSTIFEIGVGSVAVETPQTVNSPTFKVTADSIGANCLVKLA